jgi:protein-tyrosine phosphatase
MFSIFKKRNVVSDISWLGIDIHSHILPGIDDGADDVQQSLRYIKHLHELGFSKLFFTPHIFPELYPNTNITISMAYNNVVNVLVNETNLHTGFAAEYMIDYTFNIDDRLLCLPSRHLLIEMSYLSETPNIENIIFDLQVKGYKVILAHPERYNFYHKNLPRYNRLKEMGCIFQLNLLSVVGYYGKGVQKVAEYLLEKKLYDVAGTDLHHDRHLAQFTNIVESGQLYSLLGKYEFKNLELFS